MSKQTEALKLALEALLSCSAGDYSTGHVIHPSFDVDAVNKAIEAIDEALAEQCICGEPDTTGTHRTDGPCLAEQPAQQEPGRNHWEDGDVFERINAMKKQPAQPIIGLDVYLDPSDELKPKLYSPKPEQQQEPKVLMQEIARLHDRIKDLEQDVEFLSRPAQQQEPVAKVDYKQRDGFRWLNYLGWQRIPDGASLYTSPPASKPWVPLTEFDIDQIPYSCSHADSRLIAFAVEAKLREKNA